VLLLLLFVGIEVVLAGDVPTTGTLHDVLRLGNLVLVGPGWEKREECSERDTIASAESKIEERTKGRKMSDDEFIIRVRKTFK